MLSSIFTFYRILHEKICMLLNYTNHYICLLLCFYNSCANLICRNCIIDKNARIGNNVIIANKDVSNNLVVKVLYFWKLFLLILHVLLGQMIPSLMVNFMIASF